MKIVFIGGVKFSHAILEAILEGGFSIDAVFSYMNLKKKIIVIMYHLTKLQKNIK